MRFLWNNYLDDLALSLRELDNNRYPINYYYNLAWTGVKDIGAELGILESPYSTVYSAQHNELLNANYDYCN